MERRTHRSIWPLAWLQTFLLVTFRPVRAAGRLATADRAGAAMGFATLSLLVAAVLLSLHSAWAAAAVFQVSGVDVDYVPPGRLAYLGLSGWVIGLGWLCAVGVWLVMLSLPVVVAVGAANVVCDRRPAGFHAAARWACYSAAVFVWLALLSLGWAAPFYREVWAAWRRPWSAPLQYHAERGLWGAGASSDWWDASLFVRTGIAVYSVWWLIGLLASPHREGGRARVAFTAAAVTAAGWFLLAQAGPWWALSLAGR